VKVERIVEKEKIVEIVMAQENQEKRELKAEHSVLPHLVLNHLVLKVPFVLLVETMFVEQGVLIVVMYTVDHFVKLMFQ
jgi:hypothetical protein